MLKNLIKPLQNILVQKKLCPACTRPLVKAKIIESRPNATDLIECECSRLFIYDRNLDIYRRALIEEL